jgi:CheY-like chemotaxis protein
MFSAASAHAGSGAAERGGRNAESEHMIVRTVVGVAIWCFGAFAIFGATDALALSFYIAAVFYFLASGLLAWFASVGWGSVALRQTVATVLDAGAVAYIGAQGAGWSPMVFVLYSVLSADCGAKFGARALALSIGAGLIAFAISLSAAPVPSGSWPLTISLAVAMVVLPSYIYRLIHSTRAGSPNARGGSVDAALDGVYDTAVVTLHRAKQNVELVSASSNLGLEDRRRLNTIRNLVSSSIQRIESLGAASPDASEVAAPPEAFDLVELVQQVVFSDSAEMKSVTQAPIVRIDPDVPHGIVGNRRGIADVLHALMFAKLAERGRPRYIVRAARGKRGFCLRLERHETVAAVGGNAGTATSPDLLEWLAEPLGGWVERPEPDGQRRVTAVMIPVEPVADPGPPGELRGARVLLVTENADFDEWIRNVCAGVPLEISSVHTQDAAIGELEQGLRRGVPVHAVLVDPDIGSGSNAALAARALATNTPVYTASARAPAISAALTGGFDGAIGRLDVATVGRVVRASPHWRRPRQDGVVRVDPSARRGEAAAVEPRILVVDDNKTNLLIVQLILSAAGYDVKVMKSAQEALEQMLSGDYCLAILDLHMPDMDGLELLRNYRFLRPQHVMPVVFLTANRTMDATCECAEAGADAFLTKPVAREKLLGTIESLLQDRKVHRIARRALHAADADGDDRLLNRETAREVARLYSDPEEGARFVNIFRVEAEGLLARMNAALAEPSQPEFADAAHALRAVATSLGGEALVAACREAEALDAVELNRMGSDVMARVRRVCRKTIAAIEDDLLDGARP